VEHYINKQHHIYPYTHFSIVVNMDICMYIDGVKQLTVSNSCIYICNVKLIGILVELIVNI